METTFVLEEICGSPAQATRRAVVAPIINAIRFMIVVYPTCSVPLSMYAASDLFCTATAPFSDHFTVGVDVHEGVLMRRNISRSDQCSTQASPTRSRLPAMSGADERRSPHFIESPSEKKRTKCHLRPLPGEFKGRFL